MRGYILITSCTSCLSLLIIYKQIKLILKKTTPKFTILYGVIIGYILGGFASGVLHWFFDSYNFDNLKPYHNDFRTHHDNPMSLEKYSNFEHCVEITPLLLPFLLLNTLTQSNLLKIIIIISCLIGNFSQMFHKYSHRRLHANDKNDTGNYIYPRVNFIVQILQNIGLILHPKVHSRHHSVELVNYCIAHSNADKLFEYIIIEKMGLRTSVYSTNKNVYRKLSKYERRKIVKQTTLKDVICEQKYIILITIMYLFSYVYLNIASRIRINMKNFKKNKFKF